MTPHIYTREQAKAYARLLRAQSAKEGVTISHSAALERVAKACGFASWNQHSARLSNALSALQVGDRVEGYYLKRAFTGTVRALRELGYEDAYQVTIALDEPVDVVTFDSFSNFRQRISATISKDGISQQKTSDGVPHRVVTSTSSALV